MKYVDEPIKQYINDASSGQPTPGGGSIAAMTGALAGSMLNMVCNFTVGKRAYMEVETRIKEILGEGMNLTNEMLMLAVEDTEVYAEVSKAYSLPKNTEEEKQARSQAIQTACKLALQVPARVIDKGARMLVLLSELVDKGNKNLITDTGVSTLLAMASIDAAILNVRINLLFLKDEAFVAEKNRWIKKVEIECKERKELIMAKVNKACGV